MATSFTFIFSKIGLLGLLFVFLAIYGPRTTWAGQVGEEVGMVVNGDSMVKPTMLRMFKARYYAALMLQEMVKDKNNNDLGKLECSAQGVPCVSISGIADCCSGLTCFAPVPFVPAGICI